MIKKILSIILLVLLTVNTQAFSNKALNEAALKEVLAISIQTLKYVIPDLNNIKQRHYADVIGEIKGVLITLKDASNYKDSSLKETVFREALTELNKSLERSFSLALQMAAEAKDAQTKIDRQADIQHARALKKLYQQLAYLKKELHIAFNEKDTANRFEIESSDNIEQINFKIIEANNAPLPLIGDETKQGLFQMIGAVVIGVVMFIIGSLSSHSE